jgi:DNA modification methylase
MTVTVLQGDCLEVLRTLPDNSVHCCVTSPPYWGLRDYGVPPTVWGGDPDCEHEWGGMERGKRKDILPAEETALTARVGTDDRQNGAATNGGRFCAKCGAWLGVFGLEPTPELYVEHSVLIFREVRRVLREDGTLWLNLGDSYWSKPNGSIGASGLPDMGQGHAEYRRTNALRKNRPSHEVLKHKDLVGIPWRVAFALQADWWYLRSDIVWCKPNPMPESVRDRPGKSHEYIFLLAKSERYFYDIDAVREPAKFPEYNQCEDVDRAFSRRRKASPEQRQDELRRHVPGAEQDGLSVGYKMPAKWNNALGRNLRTVWTVSTAPFAGAHFATFPPKLIEPCIKAGTSEKGCCPTCGMPWKRIVAKDRKPTRPGMNSKINRASDDEASPCHTHGGMIVGNRDPQRHCTETRTVGWAPACNCDAGEPVPCVVLDPFGGAGTTGLVADRLGRDAMLIELNPEYAAMAQRRISREAPLLSDVRIVSASEESES